MIDLEKMYKGAEIRTPRFGIVKIKEVFQTEMDAYYAGYKETTHYRDDLIVVVGKSLDMYHMQFAVYAKPESQRFYSY